MHTELRTDSTSVLQDLTCRHCQEPCEDDRISSDDGAVFCCAGCKTVYEILAANDLCYFYDLDEKAGQSLREKSDKSRAYAWLDDAEIADKLLKFKQEDKAIIQFHLPQIHCASCIWLLEKLHKLDEGILSSRVQFLKKELTLQFDPRKTNLRRIASLLASIGYAPDIHLTDFEQDENKQPDRTIFYKIGVAGFVFGNIMLLSFPEYLGLDIRTDSFFAKVFGYTNLLLALPVLLYSGSDYFRSAWQGLKMRQLNIDVPLALGMLALFSRSAYEILNGTGAGYLDSLAGLVFFLLIGKWFQQKTYDHLSFERDYKSYFPVAVEVKKNGKTQSIAVQKLQIGDTIELRHGELVPADGILLKGDARMDYSFVTGESRPQKVASGEAIFAGGRQMGGLVEISLTKRVEQSYLTQLWNQTNYSEKGESDGQMLADRIGRWFTYLVLSVSGLTLVYWLLQGDIPTAINAFTAVLIIACPCAVALSIPFTFGNILQLLGRQGFYLKNTKAIEMLSKANATVFDKTGTLTEEDFIQSRVEWQAAAYDKVVQDVVTQTKPERFSTRGLTFSQKQTIVSLCRQSIHPHSQRLVQLFKNEVGNTLAEVFDFEEITGKGVQGKVGQDAVKVGSHAFVFEKNTNERTDTEGVFIEINDVVVGRFIFNNAVREDLQQVLDVFEEKGKTYLLSGDNDRDAARFQEYFPQKGQMHFRQSPQDKLDFIKKLQSKGRTVLMVGDGLNDAGALKQSNMGIAVSASQNNFTPACDAILKSSAFANLPKFLEFSAFANKTVRRAIAFAAIYNAIGLSYAVTGALSPIVAAILMPLSSISIVLFCVGSTYWKAWKLGFL